MNAAWRKLLRRSIPEPNSGCLLWLGAANKWGYGYVVIKGRTLRAHRVSWEAHNGLIPDGMMVCHKCDVRLCINPGHLFLGTHNENMADMKRKGRVRSPPGERNGLSKLKDNQIRAIRADKRTNKEIAKEYGVDPSAISRLKTRETWKHV